MANNTPGQSAPAVPLPTDVAPLRLREAFDATSADRATLSEDDLFLVRVDVVAAVVTTLGCMPKIAPFRAMIASGIPMFDLSSFDKLEPYALALMQAQTNYAATAKPMEPIEPISKELVSLREVLLADVSALEARKLVDGRRGELKGPVGYKSQASDVLLLVRVLRGAWPHIEGRSAVTKAELDHAELLADRMLTALGAREQGPKTAQAEADDRARAYTLFVQAHDQVRRVLSFLRWDEEDLDELFPTVFGGKLKPEKKKAEQTATASTAAKPTSGEPGETAATAKPAAPTGMAGSEPFGK